jgi:prepilin-type N-terminal cleavage/methylation domain-containing protein
MKTLIKRSLTNGFTLIELMIVMAIVSVLITMVGPLAINSLEKAEAKQELLTLKTWIRKISYRAYSVGQSFTLELSGKRATLYHDNTIFNNNIKTTKSSAIDKSDREVIMTKTFGALFFQPQKLLYNEKGFVEPKQLVGTYRERQFQINLYEWVNGEIEINQQNKIQP